MLSKQASRRVGLDLFRIVSAFIILCFHSIIHFECNYGPFQNFLSMGAVVMTGFFMLSGFSMYYGYSVKDLGDWNNIKGFYKKRAVGILPSYYVIAIVYILFCGSESALQNLILIPTETLGLQSVFSTLFSVTHNGGTWFISCIMFSSL